MLLAAVNSTNGLHLLCVVLLFAVIVSFIIGLAQVLGVDALSRLGGRFSGLLVFVILLVAYIIFCNG